jgi:hypothetical protein
MTTARPRPMSETVTSSRRIPATCAALAAILMLAGCGGTDAKPAPAPKPSSSPTTAAPSATPTQTPSAQPLSPFEDRAEVKVIRKWASAYGRDINAGSKTLKRAQKYESSAGRSVLPGVAGSDLGHYMPGPVPFTPVAVRTQGATSNVTACVQLRGWVTDKTTHAPIEKKKVGASLFTLKREHGGWKLDYFTAAKADCKGVQVVGETW